MPPSPHACVTERRAVARLQTLCCLGLGGPVAVPAVLAELHALIGSNGNEFYWAGPDQEMTSFYLESEWFTTLQPLYFQQFYERPRERQTALTFREVMRTSFASPVDDFYRRSLKVPLEKFRRSDTYNLLLRPLGAEQRLHVKVTEQGRPVGALHLNRRLGDPEFSARDKRVLEAVAPFIAHALASGPSDPELPMETEDKAVVIASTSGRIESFSRGAERLLRLASAPRNWADADWSNASSLPDPVASLCRSVAGILIGRPPAAAPVWQHLNPWGCFTFRAYPMLGNEPSGASAHLAVTIEREVPLPLRLFSRIDRLGLSAREEQFCLLASAGFARNEIAERLGIAVNTAITHARSIFAKLGVQSRTELIRRLRAL